MKKLIAIIIATIMVLSCSMTAFASVTVKPVGRDEFTLGNSDFTYTGDTEYVAASDNKLTVNGEVAGNSTSDDPISSVSAHSGAEINVTQTVTEKKGGDAIYAEGGATVTVGESVNEESGGNAIYANNSTVTVKGDVTESGNGNAIKASGGSTVRVGGNVIDDSAGSGGDIFPPCAVQASDGTTVIVEGAVTGNIYTNDGDVYIGKLAENSDISWIPLSRPIPNAKPTDYVHYLIGVADGSATLADILFGGDVGNDTVTGVDKGSGAKSYQYTSTADTSTTDLTITLKSNVEGKQLKNDIGALPAGVAKSYDNGVWTLTLGDGFKGGLQELQLLLEDIAHDNPDVQIDVTVSHSSGSSKPLYTGRKGNPVTNGKWTQNADGTWSYSTSNKFTNDWGYIANPNDANSAAWYYFDRNGNMLTGWQLLTWNGVKKWYYFSQTKDANEGKCQLGGITPDGYTVDETGAWTVNGVVQEQK